MDPTSQWLEFPGVIRRRLITLPTTVALNRDFEARVGDELTMTPDIASRIRRTGALGKLGEVLAAEALAARGFANVKNLNDEIARFPFADIPAKRGNLRFLIGVKSRNEYRDVGRLNGSYNCVLVPDRKNKEMRAQGQSTDHITAYALQRVQDLAREHEAVASRIGIPMRPLEGTYAAYFGLLSDIGNRRSIPITPQARVRYESLVSEWTADPRITPDLCNRRF